LPSHVRTASAIPITAIVILGLLAATLVLHGMADSGQPFALVYIALEATASIVALTLLQQLERTQARTIESAANCGGRIVQMFDGAIDAVDSSYTTVANALAGAGLIGSATFLLFGASQPGANATHLDALMVIAPKAFAATGFALCCSIVVSLRSQWPFLSSLRSWRDEVIQRQRLETETGTPDTTSLAREDLITDSIIQFTGAFQELNARNRRLTDAFERQFDSLRSNEIAQRALFEQAIKIISPAVASLEALTAILRPEIVECLPMLHKDFEALQTEVKSNSAAVSRLVQTLTSEREGVMQAQAEVLREQTVTLTREALSQLTIASGGVIRTHLDEIAKRVEQHAESVYENAYRHATESLSRTLEQTSTSTHALAESLSAAAEKLVSVQLGIHGVVTALDNGAATGESATRFRQVAEDIKRTLDAFGTTQPDSGDKPSLILKIENMAQELNQTASLVGEQWREVQTERKKLAAFRTQLVEIAKKRPAEGANG
jgi:hypothetical protein